MADNEKLIIEEGGHTRSENSFYDEGGAYSNVADEREKITYHEIAVNDREVRDPHFLVDTIVHEFGHMIEEQLPCIATENGKQLCEDKHRWADLICLRLLHPELLEQHAQSEATIVNDTIWCVNKLCENFDFHEVQEVAREVIDEAIKDHQSQFDRMVAVPRVSAEAIYGMCFPHLRPEYKPEPVDQMRSLKHLLKEGLK